MMQRSENLQDFFYFNWLQRIFMTLRTPEMANLQLIYIFQLVDWRKDKGKIEDHKTFLDIAALKVHVQEISQR